MLASISPLGERARGNRWALTVVAYALGSVAAASVVGAVLGETGALLSVPRSGRWAIAVVAAIAGAWDLLARRRLPGARRQVDEDWLSRYRGWVYGAGYGVQLGVGFATVVTTATVYAWMVASVLVHSPAAGAAVGASFGLARAAMIGTVRHATDPGLLRSRLRLLTESAHRARLGAGIASLAVGAGCAAFAATGAR